MHNGIDLFRVAVAVLFAEIYSEPPVLYMTY